MSLTRFSVDLSPAQVRRAAAALPERWRRLLVERRGRNFLFRFLLVRCLRSHMSMHRHTGIIAARAEFILS